MTSTKLQCQHQCRSLRFQVEAWHGRRLAMLWRCYLWSLNHGHHTQQKAKPKTAPELATDVTEIHRIYMQKLQNDVRSYWLYMVIPCPKGLTGPNISSPTLAPLAVFHPWRPVHFAAVTERTGHRHAQTPSEMPPMCFVTHVWICLIGESVELSKLMKSPVLLERFAEFVQTHSIRFWQRRMESEGCRTRLYWEAYIKNIPCRYNLLPLGFSQSNTTLNGSIPDPSANVQSVLNLFDRGWNLWHLTNAAVAIATTRGQLSVSRGLGCFKNRSGKVA